MTEPLHPNHPPAVPVMVDADDEIDLLEYWRILVERRRVVLTCLLACVAATMLFTFLAVPRYTAATTLQIERKSPNLLSFADVVGLDPAGYQEFYQTQFKLIQSRTVLRLAAQQLDLVNRPEFVQRKPSLPGRVIGGALGLLGIGAHADTRDPWEEAVEYLEAGLSVEPVKKSHLVRITFTDPSPTLARDVSQAVANAYISFSLSERFATSELAQKLLTQDVQRLQVEVSDKERELREFLAKNQIFTLDETNTDIREQELGTLHARLSEARARLAAAKAQYEAVQGTPDDALPEVMSSPRISNLKQHEAELRRRQTQLAERFKSDWPDLAEVEQELATVQQLLADETSGIARQVREARKAAYEEARNEVANLERDVERLKKEVQALQQNKTFVENLEEEIATKRKLLAERLGQQTEAVTSGQMPDMQAGNIRIVDPAEVPDEPSSPRKALNLALSIMLGLSLGVGMAFLAHHLDNTIKTEADIERYAPGAPVLGHVPLFEPLRVVYGGRSQAEEAAAREAAQAEAGTKAVPATPDLASHTLPRSSFAESFKSLRTALLLASPERPPRHLVVTSCEAGDGKSTVALNLAIVLTQMGKRVLLADADLRRPRLHKALATNGNELGLSNYLSGNAKFDEVVQETQIPGLHFIPSGPIPPNPSELLGSPRIEHLLDCADESGAYDVVILDSPPAIQVADGLILAAKVDSTILVVRAGTTRRDSLSTGVQRLRSSRAHLAGIILNAVPEHGRYYYRYYYQHYRYEQGSHKSQPSSSLTRVLRRMRNAGNKNVV